MSIDPHKPQCIHCGDYIERGRWYERVVGWDRPRDGGGSNQITLKQGTQIYSCIDCIERIKSNIPLGQGSLL